MGSLTQLLPFLPPLPGVCSLGRPQRNGEFDHFKYQNRRIQRKRRIEEEEEAEEQEEQDKEDEQQQEEERQQEE